MVKKHAKITPDKTLYGKLARTGYTLSQAISELVDNAIDERLDSKLLTVRVELKGDYLAVHDDAAGMDEQTAIDSVILGKSIKVNQLGEFGLGLKTASLSLGDKFTVLTTKAGDPHQYKLTFDRDEWEKQSDMDWDKFPYNKITKKDIKSHGTTIKIEKLRYNLYGRVTALRENLANRYSPFIKNNELEIQVNTKTCKSKPLDLMPGSKKDFSVITTLNYTIYGWAGLLKEGSMKGAYGFDTFRRGRLITTNDKLAIGEHPTVARVVGEINMNEIPVTHDKRGWETESNAYKDVEKSLKKAIKDVIAESQKLASRKRIKQKVMFNRDEWLDKIAEAITNPDIRQYFKPQSPDPSGTGGTTVGEAETETITIEVEQRNPGTTRGTVKPAGTDTIRDDVQKTHNVERIIKLGGKKFKFTHEYQSLGEQAAWKTHSTKPKNIIEIVTNTDFPAFSATTDQAYYAAYHVAETLAELMVSEAKEDQSNISSLKELILRHTSALKTQVKS